MKKRFIADGTFPEDVSDEYVELRKILEEPVCQRFLGSFSKKILSQESFFSWIDIQEYRGIPTLDYKRSKLNHIFKKYIMPGAVLQLGFLDEDDIEKVRNLIDEARVDKKALQNHSLDDIQSKIFMDMFKSTFIPFQSSPEYGEMKQAMTETFNRVTMDDFDLYDMIGEGGFAKVIRVRKKTTHKFYALKVQRKKDLVEMYLDDPKRLHTEKTVFAACHHPFIVNLDYSLQTPTCALLVLGLANAGNLQDVINESPDYQVPVQRVVFFAAEIVLALRHLHDLKLMYRDLKPSNVLLCEDGHIQLADMGGVADCGGSVLSNGESDPRLMTDRHGKGRRRSIMGTHGYMAPEMVKLLGQKRFERVGYTEVIDYWSLGITIFKLLSGKRPFDKKKFEKLLEERGEGENAKMNKEYALLLQEVKYPSYFSNSAKSLISGLLEVDEEKRLGSGGIEKMKAHKFFEAVDWDRLMQKHVIPPVVPPAKTYPTKPIHKDFEGMMATLTKQRRANGSSDVDWNAEIVPTDNELFKTWDFISPHTLKVEMGIAGEMEAHDTNFKVQQIIGSAHTEDSPKEKRRSILGALTPSMVSRSVKNVMS